MLVQKSGVMNLRGQQAVMQRVAAVVQASQQPGTSYLIEQTSATNSNQLGPQQIQLVRIPKIGTQTVVGANSSTPNLNIAHKRLLMHQEQQDFNVKSQMQTQSNEGGFDINGLNSINNTVAPNVQITVKPRQLPTNMSSQQQSTETQDGLAQISPRYSSVAAMQVPSVLPQSPVSGSQSNAGPPINSAVLRTVATYSNQNTSVYASPQSTMAVSGMSAGGTTVLISQAPSPFAANNRMSPAHFVNSSNQTPNSVGHASASASPSPVPPVSPMIQPIASPQSVGSNTQISQINWQQQASPSTSNRISNSIPSPAQVMSPSSSTQNMPPSNSPAASQGSVSVQQQSNPMLNAQLSGGNQFLFSLMRF